MPKVDVKIKKNKETVSVNVTGDLSRGNIAYLHRKFGEALGMPKEKMEVSIHEVTGMDITFLQVFQAFQVEVKKETIPFKVEVKLEPSLQGLLQKNGLEKIFNPK